MNIMEDIPQKGGHAIGSLMPLDQIMTNQMQQAFNQNFAPVMRELYGNSVKEQRAHQDTLTLLRAIVEGRVSPDQVAITDEGWSIKKPRPSANGADKAAEVPKESATAKAGG